MPRMGGQGGGRSVLSRSTRDTSSTCVFVCMGWSLNWGLVFHKQRLGKDLVNCLGRPSFNPI